MVMYGLNIVCATSKGPLGAMLSISNTCAVYQTRNYPFSDACFSITCIMIHYICTVSVCVLPAARRNV